MQVSNAWRQNLSSILVGILLIVLGLAWLLGQLFNIDVGHYGWPLLVIVPGAILLAVGLVSRHPAGVGLSIAGSIVTVTGLILALQNFTGLWASWAYSWALITPGGVGLGLLLHGWRTGSPGMVQAGLRTSLVGLGLFVVGAVFFELILGISGYQFGPPMRIGLATLTILIGLMLLGRYFWRRPPLAP